MTQAPCGAPRYAPFLDRIREQIPQDKIAFQVPMSTLTTLKIGGPADLLVTAESAGELAFLQAQAMAFGLPMLLLGNGSNLLVRDGGIRGLVVRMGEGLSEITVSGNHVTAKAGASLAALSKAAARSSLKGLCFACGIPGSVGGGIYMNAGAYGGEMAQVVREVEALLPDGTIRTYTNQEMHFGYRHSLAQEEPMIITAAVFDLTPGDKDTLFEEIREYNHRRNEKQPLEYPSAGSTFKRPEGYYAGQLIDQAGLRGVRVGGAQVSEKHAGFLINADHATAADFLALISLVQRTIQVKHGVWMTPEVRIVGEDTPLARL